MKKKIKVVGFLQNPWSPHYAGGTWPRESWLKALWRSRSGQRLRIMDSEEVEFYYDNATPIVCANPKDVIPPDINHIRKVLKEQNPDVIVTFGVHAASGVSQVKEEFNKPIMCLPHPTYRVVTNELFTMALNHIKDGFEGQIRYMPKRGGGVTISVIQ
jgi:hypothetical protein